MIFNNAPKLVPLVFAFIKLNGKLSPSMLMKVW